MAGLGSYIACFKNPDDERVNGQNPKTVAECATEAIKQRKAFFGMQYPRSPRKADCLMLSALPETTWTNGVQCEYKGEHLGGIDHLAVYRAPGACEVAGCPN